MSFFVLYRHFEDNGNADIRTALAQGRNFLPSIPREHLPACVRRRYLAFVLLRDGPPLFR